MEEIAIIEKFLPAQLSEEVLTEALKQIIAQTGAMGVQDLGKVMGVASKQFAGQADGKLIEEFSISDISVSQGTSAG